MQRWTDSCSSTHSVCLEQTNKYVLCSSFPQSGVEVCTVYLPIDLSIPYQNLLKMGLLGADPAII